MDLREGDRIRIRKKKDSSIVVYEGIVMPNTAAALSFMVRTSVPVVP